MPRPFLEERLPVDVRYGASWGDEYAVQNAVDAGGSDYPWLVHPFPVRHFTVSYLREQSRLYDNLLALYHRAYGKFAGFRVRCVDDYSTNGRTDAPTAFDQPTIDNGAGEFQLVKEYGDGATALDIGLPRRWIYKPVDGTVKAGIRNSVTGDVAVSTWTVDTTSGLLTLAANKSRSITAISQAAAAVLAVGSHTFTVGESVAITGVAGMTGINGRRAAVTAATSATITVAINSTGFAAYTSGGTVQTWPLDAEEVRAGCEFDIPCRFDTVIDITPRSPQYRETSDISLLELITL